jgi:hypothetical protein
MVFFGIMLESYSFSDRWLQILSSLKMILVEINKVSFSLNIYILVEIKNVMIIFFSEYF